MINVLFFIESTDIGGTEQRFVNMANYLAQTGDFDLHFAYIREGVLHQNLNKTKIKNVQIPLTEKNIPGYFNSGKILAEYINENNIEIVYSGLIRTDIICFFSKFFTHFKLFGSLVSCYSMDYIKSSLKNLTEFLLRNFLHIFCYKIISNNKSGIKNFLFKKKFEYIPNYISSETVEEIIKSSPAIEKKENEIILGTLSRLDEVKNPDVLIKSAELLSFKTDKIVVVCWVGPLGKFDLKKIKGSRIKFLHIQQHEKRFSYLKSFDICFLVSKREGLSNFLLEAVIAGKPVVASDCGDSAKVLPSEISIIVRKSSPEFVCEAFYNILSNMPDEKVFEKHKVEFIKRFSLKKTGDKLVKVLKK